MIRRDWLCAFLIVLLFAAACADSPPRVDGGRWRSWELDRAQGANPGEEIISLRIRPTWSSGVGGRRFHKRLIVYCDIDFPVFEVSQGLGDSGDEIKVRFKLDEDVETYKEEVWTVGKDAKYLRATPAFLKEMQNRHLRLDLTVLPPTGRPQPAVYSLANFEFLHAKHCKTSDKYQYVN